MSRVCPVCESPERTELFSMPYRVPDGWTLPDSIMWCKCVKCAMLYGECDKTQSDFDKYYIERYGYGVTNPDHRERLRADAFVIYNMVKSDAVIVDFGGAGDDGRSVLVEHLLSADYNNSVCVGPGDPIPACDVIYASHVIEHIYDLPDTMQRLMRSLRLDGLLIVDIPDATGLLQRWKMPILDFNTKHINHFTLRNILDLGAHHGLEAVEVKPYELEFAPCYQVHFKRLDVAAASYLHIAANMTSRIEKLLELKQPVNIWGMSDIVWHLLSMVDMDVLCYIDNDPAYRGQTYKGKPVLERPDNDAPILILAQGQRKRLIENIRKMGVENSIIEI